MTNIFKCMLIFLILRTLNGCNSQLGHSYKTNSEIPEDLRAQLERAEKDAEGFRKRAQDSKKVLKEGRFESGENLTNEGRRMLESALKVQESDLMVVTVRALLVLVEMIEKNQTKSNEEILAHWKKNKKSKSDVLDLYFNAHQKPVKEVLHKLAQEELDDIKTDLDGCLQFIYGSRD